MNWHMVRLADVAATPWRNGGGVTRELVAWPAHGEWVWRMSVAEVAASGPFSRFDGVDRWFAVLHGAGVRLEVDGSPHTLTSTDAPLHFDGAASTECTLLQDATRDFNLMVRQSAGPSRMERVNGQFGVSLNAPKIIAVYASNTGATLHFSSSATVLEPHTLVWCHVPTHAHVQVEAADALWMELTP